MKKLLKFMLLIFGFVLYRINKLLKYSLRIYINCKFKHKGTNCSIGDGEYTYENIYLGNNIYIADDCMFISKNANIKIGNNVMIGPKVTIITGNHKINDLKKPMFFVGENDKDGDEDQDVFINDDVWIGVGSIILKGVTIGKGCVIGAGSIITSDIPPYSIVHGQPAKVCKKRFNELEIVTYESNLKKFSNEN